MIKPNLDELASAKNLLLLQGPIGPFFYSLSKWLRDLNKRVFKINFNMGDEYFYPSHIDNTFVYFESLEKWQSYLVDFCEKNKIDAMVCFGDCRKYHRIAKTVAKQKNISFWVFEEGYFRPDYITLEKDGVNDFSPLPRTAEFFLQQAEQVAEPSIPQPLAQGFIPLAKLAIQYYWNASWYRNKYPYYQHHRELDIKYYIKLWLSSGIKRAYYFIRDYRFTRKVTKGYFGDFFIVPLQVYDDSQVKYHCDYENVEMFLREVIASFVTFAPAQSNLIVKHHPMDRGFIDYSSIIETFKAKYPTLKKRLYYIHDVPMPALLRKAKGMITLNSTSGISALLHHLPVITLGRANYHIKGLTYQGNLDTFWTEATPPDEAVFQAYRKYHLYKTHLNGSYYNKVILKKWKG